MQTAWAGRGLLAAVAGIALGVMGAAVAQETPGTQPVPRPPAATVTEAAAATTIPAAAAASLAAARVGPVTGFPIPRYVSIKASEANARRGPSRSHRIDWVFQRRDMPVMVVAEHGHWRRVVDRDGAGGWMHYTLLSGVRTAIIEQDMTPLYLRPDRDAMVRAHAEQGVIGELRQCRDDWCEMQVGGFRGWVEARVLWGVEPGEEFD